jgi:hypothetical protein
MPSSKRDLLDEWSAAEMNVRKIVPTLMILLCSLLANAQAQTFGQFTAAGAAADGEGSVFMLAGNNAFRTGLSARFNLSSVSDFGIQLGVDRACEESFFGGGIDLKVVLLESRADLPVSLALDASFGSLTSDAVGRFLFGFGILASGRIETRPARAIEPYLSFIVEVEQIDERRRNAETRECLCPGNDDSTETATLVRAGVKIPMSHDTQLLIEAGINRRTLFGAAFNVVF